MAINPINFISRGVFQGGVPGFSSWGFLLIGGSGFPAPTIFGELQVIATCRFVNVQPAARQLSVALEV